MDRILIQIGDIPYCNGISGFDVICVGTHLGDIELILIKGELISIRILDPDHRSIVNSHQSDQVRIVFDLERGCHHCRSLLRRSGLHRGKEVFVFKVTGLFHARIDISLDRVHACEGKCHQCSAQRDTCDDQKGSGKMTEYGAKLIFRPEAHLRFTKSHPLLFILRKSLDHVDRRPSHIDKRRNKDCDHIAYRRK